MSSNRTILPLATGYTSEVDAVDEPTWCRLLSGFDNANIYQTWSYASVISGARNVSHLILRKDYEIVAIAQARIARLPVIRAGVAYVFWGPLWRRDGREDNHETFRQVLRALRAEYVVKRGLTLRLFPLLLDIDSPFFLTILKEEGFLPAATEAQGRTILMDLTPSLEDLRAGMKSHWKRELKVADKCGLELTEGSSESQFSTFIDIYREMVSRKHFVEPNDINKFRQIQERLPAALKMKVLLCRSGDSICAGAICSTIGKTAVYLFGATSNAGMKSRGSYFLQWKLIEQLKEEGVTTYDLNGINPEKNPGTYKFKDDLAGTNGKDAHFLGRFDAQGSLLSHLSIKSWDRLSSSRRSLRQLAKSVRAGKVKPNLAKSPAKPCSSQQ
jgi:Acetyltransferase (GNAT) domain